jgi:acyl-CoA thioester hydrolase
MPALKIKLPSKYIFCTRIPIRIQDIGPMSQLSRVGLIEILEEARTQFMINLGYEDMVKSFRGKSFILGDLGVTFKGTAGFGQTLQIEIGIANVHQKSFDMVYLVTNFENQSEVARAKTALLAFDYQTQKVVPLPEELREKLLKK